MSHSPAYYNTFLELTPQGLCSRSKAICVLSYCSHAFHWDIIQRHTFPKTTSHEFISSHRESSVEKGMKSYRHRRRLTSTAMKNFQERLWIPSKIGTNRGENLLPQSSVEGTSRSRQLWTRQTGRSYDVMWNMMASRRRDMIPASLICSNQVMHKMSTPCWTKE